MTKAWRYGSYSDLAGDYYDARRHPTSSNFRSASAQIVESWMSTSLPRQGQIADVGAGDSLVAELLQARRRSLRRLTLIDSSSAMLGYSRRWVERGATAVVADARAVPYPTRSFALIIASLGDPFNDNAFWNEAHRLLAPNGVVIYTTPSFEWASMFRARTSKPIDAAEFVTQGETTILVPSYVYTEREQINLLAAAGFETHLVQRAFTGTVRNSELSAKLDQLGAAPLLVGYLARPARGSH